MIGCKCNLTVLFAIKITIEVVDLFLNGKRRRLH